MEAVAADIAELEPFGQRSARAIIRAALLLFCGVAVIVSMLMLVRSASNYDSLTLVYGGRHYEIASAFDRLALIVGEPRPGDVESLNWLPQTAPIRGFIDAWQPSLLKTLGVEFTTDPDRSTGRADSTVWRLRLKWRTLMIAYALPLIFAIARHRAARRRQVADADAATLSNAG